MDKILHDPIGINPRNYGAIVHLGSSRIFSISSSIYLYGIVYTICLHGRFGQGKPSRGQSSSCSIARRSRLSVCGSGSRVYLGAHGTW